MTALSTARLVRKVRAAWLELAVAGILEDRHSNRDHRKIELAVLRGLQKLEMN